MQIDPVGERSRETRPIAADLRERADASSRTVACVSAGTGIRRADQCELRWKPDAAGCAHDRDVPVLERLAHRVEGVTRKLEQLVEKEHAAVREAHFARARARAATDEPRDRDGVMG